VTGGRWGGAAPQVGENTDKAATNAVGMNNSGGV